MTNCRETAWAGKLCPPYTAFVTLLILIQILVACVPAARDDFSVIGNDVLSMLLRDAHSDVNLTPGNSYGAIGVGALNKEKANFLANNMFVHKSRDDVFKLFHEHDGKCDSENVGEIFQCSFTRKWKLKNIGASFDVSNWSDPSARFDFSFTINKADQMVASVKLEVKDVTEYKKIKN